MFRAARAALKFFRRDPAQIELPLPPSPVAFRARLTAAGLGPGWIVTMTDNLATMVSFRGRSVRIHRAYVDAPDDVIEAIVHFVTVRRRDVRRAAGRVILSFAPSRPPSDVVAIRSRERTHRADRLYVERLREAHHTLNSQLFRGELHDVSLRVSRRMRRKLGHYSPATHGLHAEIAIGRRHIRDDTWDDVLHTLLHEMVHQWQDENGYPLAHDGRFRRIARAVGADPFAVRRESRAHPAISRRIQSARS